MKQFFVCSDIHGFYDEWMVSLKEAGFEKNNENHILIVLGDIFDRGNDPWNIYLFLKSLPKERIYLIKGNHEYLLLKLVKRKYPLDIDYYNGTYGTLVSLYKDPYVEFEKQLAKNKEEYGSETASFQKTMRVFLNAQKRLYNNKKINEIIEWIRSPQWLNYCEIMNYIFVHSFIPLNNGKYFPYWRNESTLEMWEEATWGCPYQLYKQGLFDKELNNGKILVCGHWHTADFYNNLLYKDNPKKQLDFTKENPIFVSEEYPGLIGLDTCTALTKKVNVFVIYEFDKTHR